jgi:hypothetical protein
VYAAIRAAGRSPTRERHQQKKNSTNSFFVEQISPFPTKPLWPFSVSDKAVVAVFRYGAVKHQ